MLDALNLAKRGLGHTFPNPAVGCVIVKDGQVLFLTSVGLVWKLPPHLHPER